MPRKRIPPKPKPNPKPLGNVKDKADKVGGSRGRPVRGSQPITNDKTTNDTQPTRMRTITPDNVKKK